MGNGCDFSDYLIFGILLFVGDGLRQPGHKVIEKCAKDNYSSDFWFEYVIYKYYYLEMF